MSGRKRKQLDLKMMCAVSGILLGLLFQNSTLGNNKELTGDMSVLQQEKQHLIEKVDAYAETIKELEKQQDHLVSEIRTTHEELSGLKIIAGFAGVSGPGVIITLNDSPNAKEATIDTNVFLIHDEDILEVVNELFAAGAEAVSINDQRVVAHTSVRCVGPVVTVNGVKLAAPYQISAVGNPETLESALMMPNGVVDNLRPWGITVEIEQAVDLVIPAYDQTILLREAKPFEMEAEQ